MPREIEPFPPTASADPGRSEVITKRRVAERLPGGGRSEEMRLMLLPTLLMSLNALAPGERPDPERIDDIQSSTMSAALTSQANRPIEDRLEDLEDQMSRLLWEISEASAPPISEHAASGAPPNVFNPTLTVAGNGLFRYDDRAVLVDEARIDKTFNVREVELDLRAAVDPFADAVLILAVPSEVPGEFSLELEEGFVTVKRLPIPLLDEPPLGLKLRAGRFRTETGRINRLHLHDLPQVTRPLVLEEVFGEDGHLGNGASAQLFLPTPFDEESALELTAQALAGGGVAVAGGPARSPAFVGNLRWFRTFGGAHSVDLALIFHFGKTDPEGQRNAFTYGGDFLYRWKPLRGGEFRSFVLGGQALASRRSFLEIVDGNGDGAPESSGGRRTHPFGYFSWAQLQLARTTYLGARWDDAASIDDDAIRRRAISGYVTWYASEFLRFRFGYEHRLSDLAEEDDRNSAFVELNFIFGAHPPEPFWVNK